jgi:hypothetical protein
MEKEFDYRREESDAFGSIKRPRIERDADLFKKEEQVDLGRGGIGRYRCRFLHVTKIFGRVKAMDLFDANFLKGEMIKLRLEE